MKQQSWWLISTSISLLLIIILAILWYYLSQHTITSTQLVNEPASDNYLNQHPSSYFQVAGAKPNHTDLVKIKTGIFIQSLKFIDEIELTLKGVIWQHYEDGVHDNYKPNKNEVGFIFPDQVNPERYELTPKVIYRNRISHQNKEVIGWSFEATLRHSFDYTMYPFDHKTVSIRIWPKNFLNPVVLSPDYDAYKGTGKQDIFGIDENIVLGRWVRKDTYFDYKTFTYNTNFGLSEGLKSHHFPELNFNFVLKRKTKNAVVSHLLLLLFVSILLFIVLLTVSQKQEVKTKHGFTTSVFISAASGLLFSAILSHIQLREEFSDVGIVYIEYFYLLFYTLLVIVTFSTYLFITTTSSTIKWLHYKDHLLIKVAYWPTVLTSMIFITLLVIE